jgi:hypothetical protein
VDRSVESLRGKKYPILREQRRIGAKSRKHPGHRSRAGAHRSAGRNASLANLTRRRPAQSNIEKWVQTILTTETSHNDSIEINKDERLETRYELIFIHLLLQVNHASQAARCHYSALHGVKKRDRRRRFGTMYIVSVQPGR